MHSPDGEKVDRSKIWFKGKPPTDLWMGHGGEGTRVQKVTPCFPACPERPDLDFAVWRGGESMGSVLDLVRHPRRRVAASVSSKQGCGLEELQTLGP